LQILLRVREAEFLGWLQVAAVTFHLLGVVIGLDGGLLELGGEVIARDFFHHVLVVVLLYFLLVGRVDLVDSVFDLEKLLIEVFVRRAVGEVRVLRELCHLKVRVAVVSGELSGQGLVLQTQELLVQSVRVHEAALRELLEDV